MAHITNEPSKRQFNLNESTRKTRGRKLCCLQSPALDSPLKRLSFSIEFIFLPSRLAALCVAGSFQWVRYRKLFIELCCQQDLVAKLRHKRAATFCHVAYKVQLGKLVKSFLFMFFVFVVIFMCLYLCTATTLLEMPFNNSMMNSKQEIFLIPRTSLQLIAVI